MAGKSRDENPIEIFQILTETEIVSFCLFASHYYSKGIYEIIGSYAGPAKCSVTNRLPKFYSRYFKMLHCTWMVCWIANDTRLFRTNCFLTDRVIWNWNRCSHIHWPIYLLRNNQAKDGQEFTFYMTTPPLISVRLVSLFWLLKRWKF